MYWKREEVGERGGNGDRGDREKGKDEIGRGRGKSCECVYNYIRG